MYAAVAAEEISEPFDNDRRVLLSPNKEPHVFERLRSNTGSDIAYTGIELPSLTRDTFSTTPEQHRRSIWTGFWQDTKYELKTFRWRKWTQRFLALALPPILIITLLLITIWICIPGRLFRSTDVSRPDGNFYYGLKSYVPWRTESLFQIDVGFGNLSFANAKLIDFWWDLVCLCSPAYTLKADLLQLVGRGGQLFMGYVSYKACTKALIFHMERHAVPIDTFEAITVQDHSMTGLVKLVKGVTANRDPRSLATMVWFIVGASYICCSRAWLVP